STSMGPAMRLPDMSARREAGGAAKPATASAASTVAAKAQMPRAPIHALQPCAMLAWQVYDAKPQSACPRTCERNHDGLSLPDRHAGGRSVFCTFIAFSAPDGPLHRTGRRQATAENARQPCHILRAASART